MGATASRESPSLPAKCGLFEKKESDTYLFTVPHYSKWARMPAGTALNFDALLVGRGGYRLKVYPAGFDEDSSDYVAVFLSIYGSFRYTREGALRFLFEILDSTGQHAVFDNYTAGSGQQTLKNGEHSSRGYVRFVKRREMEASSCVRRDADSLVVRCTVSVHRPVTKRPAKVLATEAAPSSPSRGSHGVTISGISELKAALRIGECLHSTQFMIGGSSWYLKVYPNGRCDASKDYVSVFLGRGRSDEAATTAEFRFEVVGLAGGGEEERMTHTFDHDNPVHGVECLVTSRELESADVQMARHNRRLVVRCWLRVIEVTAATPSSLLAADRRGEE